MPRLALVTLVLLSACSPARNDCGDECRAIIVSSLLRPYYPAPTTQARDCYATGAHAGVITTCY